MNSLMTRYGVIGASADASFACHLASHASRSGRDLVGRRTVQQPPAEPVLHRIGECRQCQLRIAQQRHLGRVALVQVARVVGGVDDAHAGRQRRRGQRMSVQTGADAEDQVGLGVQEVRAMAGEAVAAGPERTARGPRGKRSCRPPSSSPGFAAVPPASPVRRWLRRTARPGRPGSPDTPHPPAAAPPPPRHAAAGDDRVGRTGR